MLILSAPHWANVGPTCLAIWNPHLWHIHMCVTRPKQGQTKWPQFSWWHFQRDFLEWKYRIFFNISVKFILKGPINNIPALFQVMAWHWPGDKPLSKPMMVGLLMLLCITRPNELSKCLGQNHATTFKVAFFSAIFVILCKRKQIWKTYSWPL